MTAPDPLTPADCDLRDFPFMPLEIQRLRRSKAWLKAKRNPALAFYQINLWTAAWHDVPAGSLEDDEDVLADLAMCDPGKWPKVRDEVMRGWIKCSDGRLYNPTVCEKALESWAAKVERRDKDEHERDRKRREREDRARMFDTLKEAGQSLPWNTPTTELRRLVSDMTRDDVTTGHDLSHGQVRDSHGKKPGQSRLRERQGEGEGDSNSVPDGTDARASLSAADGVSKPKPEKTPEELAKAELWRAAVSVLEQGGCPPSQCRTFMGKLVQDYGFPVVKDAVLAAVTEQPADAREYLKACCQRMSGERKAPNRQEALEANNRAVADRLAAELAGAAQ